VALQLRRQGITRVRPLAGGFEAWVGAGLAVEWLPGGQPPGPPPASSAF
jgi:rhodanese-related sulfurtransferase